jgi:purine-binding chemotaxis protein CheW
LRAKPEIDDNDTLCWVAEFPLGRQDYALALSSLVGAVPLRSLTPVPLAPPELIGVVLFQGEILTAFSLSAFLGPTGWKQDPSVLLVVEIAHGNATRRIAVDCEQVPRALALPQQAVERARFADDRKALREVTTADLRVLHLIDVDCLLAGRSRQGGEARLDGAV